MTKLLTLGVCLLASSVILASPIAKEEANEPIAHQVHHSLVGARECTWGPSYWCSNITNAKSCNAVGHCIQTVWEKHTVPEDTDSICKICLDMVQQARDQLESNETQEDLKLVFEGSCLLIPISLVSKQCINLVDNFIPELVEALSSQMNPQAVCSVAGLCNNAAIDKMIEDEAVKSAVAPVVQPSKSFTCDNCKSIGNLITDKFQRADRDYILEAVLRQCGQMSSFSDACSNIALTYFNELYDYTKSSLSGDSICHMSGACSLNFHQHPERQQVAVTVEQLQQKIRPADAIAVQEDIPCELCKQLVQHLKELLIANTTEVEFKSVLEGLCKQTKSFKSECLSIVDQYYANIYNSLVSNLSGNEACVLIEICPRAIGSFAPQGDIAPLLPAVQAARLSVHITALPKLTKKKFLGEDEPILTNDQIAQAQLPIDVLLGAPNYNQLVGGGQYCMICEYAAHFIQTTLAEEKTEAEIKQLLKKMCAASPKKLHTVCDEFVDNYGDAFIALFIQEIDPNQICTAMFVCSTQKNTDAEVIIETAGDGVTINGGRRYGAEKCPMCLFAVAQAQAAVKSDKSKSNIRLVLNRLCVHLPTKMKMECNDFVETYTNELVDMLANDFTPEAICVQLHICDPQTPTKPEFVQKIAENGDVETNEIPDDTFNGELITSILVDYEASPNCLLCETVVKEAEKHFANKKSKAQIKASLERACAKMPKLQTRCSELIDKYGDRIVDLVLAEFTPKQICRELGMCIVEMQIETEQTKPNLFANALLNKDQELFVAAGDDDLRPFDGNTAYIHAGDSSICVLCQTIMTQLENELKDKSTQKEIEDTVKNICHTLPKEYDEECSKYIDNYASLIISLIDTTPPKLICAQINLCAPRAITESKLEVIECAVCHSATQSLVRVLEDPKVERDVEHVMEKTCTRLPGKYYQRCVKMVQVYGPSMINIISRSGELQTICTQIGMCYPDEYASFAQISDL